MLQVKRISQITLFSAASFDSVPGVVHAFSTRRADHNDFTLGPTGSSDPMIQINRARFLAAAGAPGWPILKLKQIHSSTVCDMQDTWASNEPVEGDAAVTSLRGALLAVQTADCVPILIADRNGRSVAAVHAGWRGTAAGIVGATVKRLADRYNVPPDDLLAAIGPHNAVCCYEVGTDVVQAIKDPAVFEQRPGWSKPHLNQALANQLQLIRAGVPENQILVSSLCTQCRPGLFFSYRREGKQAGRLLSVIGLEP